MGSPLSDEHFRALSEARVRAKKVRRAAAVAVTSGWSMLFFAMLTLLGGLLGDMASLVMGLALAGLSVNELIGASMVRALNPAGARRLGFNQLVLGGLLVVYAGWSLWTNLQSPAMGELSDELAADPQMQAVVGQVSSMVTWVLYGGMAVFGLVVPGLTAVYYFSRARAIRSVIETTPEWVIEAMRRTG
ncbi:MAG: hypothetical protein NTV94_02735 [Planctomycetota bacterium]|nr:hypothetical protein [Planctomycetota bacterium]